MIPNLITLSRVFILPLFLYLLFLPGFNSKVWALIVFILASLTDAVDGWAARKLNSESEFGKFLDPLADKIFVIVSVTGLLLVDPLIQIWMVVIIAGRDLLVTLLRYLAIKKGNSVRTTMLGKFKTAFQMVSVVIILVVYMFQAKGFDVSSIDHSKRAIVNATELLLSGKINLVLVALPYWLLFIAAFLTALSGIRYVIDNGAAFLPPYRKKEESK